MMTESADALRLRRAAARLRRDEDGSMIIFGLFMFIIMLMAGGMAIDFMRFENSRVEQQNTLDRAILASAALNQALPPQDVIESYFDKSKLTGYNLHVESDSGLNFKTVTATSTTTNNSMFLNILGIKDFAARVGSGAEERINKVEVSLVLDISGSMGSNNKIGNLKIAAKDFVDTLIPNGVSDQVSISIIPYSAQVTVGPDLFSKYNVQTDHASSTCIVFESSDFHTTSLSQTQPLKHEGHFQPDSSSTSPINNAWCDTDRKLEIKAFSNVAPKLKLHIDGLRSGGNTASDVGMKWGTALLDPGSQPVLSALVAEGQVDPVLEGRPAAWTDPDTLKIVVLMTDGDNTTQYDLKDQYKRGNSNIWYDSNANRWYQYIPNYNRYYYSNGTSTYWYNYYGSIPDTAKRYTWPELWAEYAIHRFAYRFYDRISSSLESYWKYEPYETSANDNLADTRLAANCAAAKAKKIIVFTIGFEAPNWAKTMMRNCATTPAHYYDVQGIQISDAFNAIASTIQRLKLTQ